MSQTLAPAPMPHDILREAYEIAKQRDQITQVKLAGVLGVKQQTISNWINGTREPTLREAARFLAACNAPRRIYLALKLLRPYLTAAA